MIKTLIIEDEMPAAQRLEKMLKQCNDEIEIISHLDSIESSIEWLKNNPQPDLVMLDIQLADGQSFEIFKHVKLTSFVIFTTAYDEYALKAFDLNSIDYLLKPIKYELLCKSISKFLNLRKTTFNQNYAIEEVIEFISQRKSNYKKRFVINIGNSIKIINNTELAYFYSTEKNTFLCTTEGKNYPVDFSLDNLETILDPERFFRINRQYIIEYGSIKKINILSKSRIKLELIPPVQEDVLVSSTKSPEFRKWLDK